MVSKLEPGWWVGQAKLLHDNLPPNAWLPIEWPNQHYWTGEVWVCVQAPYPGPADDMEFVKRPDRPKCERCRGPGAALGELLGG